MGIRDSLALKRCFVGFGAIEARSAVRAFLESWRRRKPGAVVQIVTGKGKGSAGG